MENDVPAAGAKEADPPKDLKATKRILMNKAKEHVQNLHKNFLEKVDAELNELIENLVTDFIFASSPPVTKFVPPAEASPRHRPTSPTLKDKEFIARNSMLTDLLEIKHFRTIYNIFIAILILIFFSTVVYDYIDRGNLILNLDLFRFAFGHFDVVMGLWIAMFLSLVAVAYPAFRFWFQHAQHPDCSRLWNIQWLLGYVVFLCAFFYLPVRKVFEIHLPPCSSLVVLTEQIRFAMKIHAFVRHNAPKAWLPVKEKSVDTQCPNFSKFLYFLFAPTLIYRDSYPRTPTIRWQYVVVNFSQVLGCIFYVYFVVEWFLVPVFERFGHDPLSLKNLFLVVFASMLPATLIFFCSFFALLHAWMNAFAEMLRFADRLFYLDWWNSTSFATYYRTWNVVVHDWLYTYIYKDINRFFPRARLVSIVAVFMVSAIVHEYIITFALGFFYPVLFVLFGGFGVWFVFLTDKRKAPVWNVFMWVTIFSGTGFMFSLYCIEWYARQNCPPNTETLLDYAIPRSWFCYYDSTNGHSKLRMT